MPNRMIKSGERGHTVHLVRCLASLFSVELLYAGPVIYLISPWISNVILLNNRYGQFRALFPNEPRGEVRLAPLLNALARRGSKVRVVCRPKEAVNEAFRQRLSPGVEVRYAESVHEKGLLTPLFYLRGSMNFTHFGVYVNDEHLELSSESAFIAEAYLSLHTYWEHLE